MTVALHKMADDYYAWRNENYPVQSSYAGLHTWDDRLTDYSPAKSAERAQHGEAVLAVSDPALGVARVPAPSLKLR